MKGKNGVKLADFIREIINTKISEKPVKSRIFEDFKGIRKAPLRLLLSGRSEVRIPSGTPCRRERWNSRRLFFYFL
jgi:hypothetical protein